MAQGTALRRKPSLFLPEDPSDAVPTDHGTVRDFRFFYGTDEGPPVHDGQGAACVCLQGIRLAIAGEVM